MTARELLAAKRLIDKARREQLSRTSPQQIGASVTGCCRGCGSGYDAFTEGCRPCQERRRRHRGVRRDVRTHNANGYRNGCRCQVCTSAHTVVQRERRRNTSAAGTKAIGVNVPAAQGGVYA